MDPRRNATPVQIGAVTAAPVSAPFRGETAQGWPAAGYASPANHRPLLGVVKSEGPPSQDT